jgi:hypothetical protein
MQCFNQFMDRSIDDYGVGVGGGGLSSTLHLVVVAAAAG